MASHGGLTLRIFFEGLCSFVPNSPFFVKDAFGQYHPGKPRHFRVFLPDVRSPGIGDWEMAAPMQLSKLNPHPYFRSSHAPILSLRPYDIYGTDVFSVDGVVADPITQEMRVLHVLDYESLVFSHNGNGGWPPLSFDSTIPADPSQGLPQPGECSSLWWVPRLSEISSDHQCCQRRLLKASPSSFENAGIACRIKVPRYCQKLGLSGGSGGFLDAILERLTGDEVSEERGGAVERAPMLLG